MGPVKLQISMLVTQLLNKVYQQVFGIYIHIDKYRQREQLICELIMTALWLE